MEEKKAIRNEEFPFQTLQGRRECTAIQVSQAFSGRDMKEFALNMKKFKATLARVRIKN